MKIALFGKIRSGKDTVGKILIQQYGFKKFAFGDGIGNIIKEYFPEAWEGGKPRKHYQHIGQQLRVLNHDVWINYLLKNIKDSKQNIIITDGRQLNEAIRLKEEGFLIVKVETPEELRIERMKALGDVFTKEDLQHETEKNVDLIIPDILITNETSLKELEHKVNKMLIGLGVE